MKVKEVLSEALRLVGRDDVADAIDSNALLTDEQTRIKRAFLTYFNSVFDELARGYFPLDARDVLCAKDGKFALADLTFSAVRITRVTDGEKPIEWRIYPDYLYADAEEVTVFYEYAPDALTENDEFCYPVYAVGKNLVEYGVAAEYYLVLGAAAESRSWENKYRDEIEALMARSRVNGRIPPRRWI